MKIKSWIISHAIICIIAGTSIFSKCEIKTETHLPQHLNEKRIFEELQTDITTIGIQKSSFLHSATISFLQAIADPVLLRHVTHYFLPSGTSPRVHAATTYLSSFVTHYFLPSGTSPLPLHSVTVSECGWLETSECTQLAQAYQKLTSYSDMHVIKKTRSLLNQILEQKVKNNNEESIPSYYDSLSEKDQKELVDIIGNAVKEKTKIDAFSKEFQAIFEVFNEKL